MHLKTGRNYLLYILTIIAGGTMAHSLVPPTPGPLFVAYELGVDIGLGIICGTIVGVFTTASGYLWARFISTRIIIPLRESADLTKAQLKAMAERTVDNMRVAAQSRAAPPRPPRPSRSPGARQAPPLREAPDGRAGRLY